MCKHEKMQAFVPHENASNVGGAWSTMKTTYPTCTELEHWMFLYSRHIYVNRLLLLLSDVRLTYAVHSDGCHCKLVRHL